MTWDHTCIKLITLFAVNFHLQCFVMIFFKPFMISPIQQDIIQLFCTVLPDWGIRLNDLVSTHHGDPLYPLRYILRGRHPHYTLSKPSNSIITPHVPHAVHIYPTFNVPECNILTTNPLCFVDTVPSANNQLQLPLNLSFAKYPTNPSLCSNVAIIDPAQPMREPILKPLSLFEVWFGIPFTDQENVTRIRSVDPTEIINIYQLPSLLPLYPTILTSRYLCHIFLHYFPLHTPN